MTHITINLFSAPLWHLWPSMLGVVLMIIAASSDSLFLDPGVAVGLALDHSLTDHAAEQDSEAGENIVEGSHNTAGVQVSQRQRPNFLLNVSRLSGSSLRLPRMGF